MLILSTLSVGGCTPSTAEPTGVPTSAPTEAVAETPSPTSTPTEVAVEVPDPARARDVALAYASGRYGE